MSSLRHALADLGWNAWFAQHLSSLSSDQVPARVVAEHRGGYELLTEAGPCSATLSGRLRHAVRNWFDYPRVGDWVAARCAGPRGAVDRVLPRMTQLVRQSAGERGEPQVVAANVDLVIVVMALDHDFNPRRLERWAALVESSGALPCVLLNKADLCPDPQPFADQAAACMPGARVVVASAAMRQGLEALRAAVRPGLTAVLVGASGAGKSTLANAWLGHASQETRDVREHDSRGRHATTHRELFVLPGGGILVDTPGLRELAAWGDVPSPSSFDDLDELATQCRFGNCRHAGEPGCALGEAVARGDLDEARLRAWGKLLKERAYLTRKQDAFAARAEAARWKQITKSMREREALEGSG